MARPRACVRVALAGLLVTAACVSVRASDSSSASGSVTPPPSVSSREARAAAAQQSEESQEPRAAPTPRIKELGILEGRERNTHFLHPYQPGPAADEVEGAFAGRNRKKKKHRRIHAVEVQTRKLEKTGALKADGSLDVRGLLQLAAAEEERAAAPEGIVQQKEWTMEELDLAYPDPEGNARLGLTDPASPAQRARPRAKFERSSHLVQMRAPGAVEGLIPDELLNYRREQTNITVLVLGSMGHTYCITVQPRFSVGEFKELVWEQEREHRDAEQDAREGFRVHRQRLVLERGLPDPASPRRNDPAAKPLRTPPGTADASRAARSHAPATFGTFLLGPEIRTLGWYNVTEYDLFFVLPAIPKASAEEDAQFQEFCFDMAYEREIDKSLAAMEDEDDKDPVYRAVKKAYLEASEATFENLFLANPHFKANYNTMIRDDPNFGLRPHPRLDEKRLQEMKEECDEMLTPGYFANLWEDVERASTDPEILARAKAFEKECWDDRARTGPTAVRATPGYWRDIQEQGKQMAELFLPVIPQEVKARIQEQCHATEAPLQVTTNTKH